MSAVGYLNSIRPNDNTNKYFSNILLKKDQGSGQTFSPFQWSLNVKICDICNKSTLSLLLLLLTEIEKLEVKIQNRLIINHLCKLCMFEPDQIMKTRWDYPLIAQIPPFKDSLTSSIVSKYKFKLFGMLLWIIFITYLSNGILKSQTALVSTNKFVIGLIQLERYSKVVLRVQILEWYHILYPGWRFVWNFSAW